MILPSSLASLSWNGSRVGPTAPVERAHSDRARSGSKGSAWVSFHPFQRGSSASKERFALYPNPFSISISSLHRKQSRRPPLQEQNHKHKNEDLAIHGAEARFDQLVQPADPQRGHNRACQFSDPAGDYNHEGVDDADHRERPARDARQPRSKRKGIGVDFSGWDAEAGAHISILGHRPHA